MPVFSFEKISPPSSHGPVVEASVVTKQPGVIVQMLVRLVEARARRASRDDKAGSERKPY